MQSSLPSGTPIPGDAAATGTPARGDGAEDAVLTALMTLGRRLRQRLPGDELDFSAIPVLKLLRDGPGRLSTLADALELDASTVSRHVRQLEERGLVERADDPDDRRASRVALSAHGRAALAEHLDRRQVLLGAVLADWDAEDRAVLRTLMLRLCDDLSALDWPAACRQPPSPLGQEPPR